MQPKIKKQKQQAQWKERTDLCYFTQKKKVQY